MGWLDHLDPVPHALWHDERLTGTDLVTSLDADTMLVAIVEDDLTCPDTKYSSSSRSGRISPRCGGGCSIRGTTPNV